MVYTQSSVITPNLVKIGHTVAEIRADNGLVDQVGQRIWMSHVGRNTCNHCLGPGVAMQPRQNARFLNAYKI